MLQESKIRQLLELTEGGDVTVSSLIDQLIYERNQQLNLLKEVVLRSDPVRYEGWEREVKLKKGKSGDRKYDE